MMNIDQTVTSGFIFVLSVDGTHCPIEDPSPWSSQWASHKLGMTAGVSYEIGLAINKSKLVWVRGPTPAGKQPDISDFRDALKHMIPERKRAIGDDGYNGEPNVISTRNEFDSYELSNFKDCVLARQESFNSCLKDFNVLKTKFRHGASNHKAVFDAVCAIVLYNMENGDKPLFNPYPLYEV
eukprot:8408509-Ditylum_brightwellii.AAC.1